MLRNFLIFSLCFVAIRATGEFSVLSSPKSIVFKGNDVLQSDYVGDVLYAAMGNPIAVDVSWTALTINDPFNMPKGLVTVFVDSCSSVGFGANAKTYELEGSTTDEALNAVSAELEANNMPVCDINFNDFEEALDSYRSCFGDAGEPVIKETKALNPALHTADKQFLQAISLVHAAADNLATMEKASNFLIIRLSLESIAKAHGEKSEATIEAKKLVTAAIAKLNAAAQKSSNNEALVVAITTTNAGKRTKRETLPPNATANPYNLAKYYSPDFPVMFNIILWFVVAFFLSLLAICYAIGTMDPGRDSIIYRMTSTRMKKDN